MVLIMDISELSLANVLLFDNRELLSYSSPKNMLI